MLRNISYRILSLASAAVLLAGLIGCERDILSDDKQQDTPQLMNVNAQLSITLPYVDEAAGTDAENRIDILDVFFVPIDENTGQEIYNIGHDSVLNITIGGHTGETIQGGMHYEQNADLKPGRYHVYLAANLNVFQREHLRAKGPNADYTSSGSTGAQLDNYSKVVYDAARYDFQGETIDDNTGLINLVMFGIGKDANANESEVFEVVKPDTGRIQVRIKTDLTRVVAKVHLTSEVVSENGTDYIPLDGDLIESDGRVRGWIRLKDLKYIANATNKKFYFRPQVDEENKTIDPNYKVSECVKYEDKEYKEAREGYVNENFVYYSIERFRNARHPNLLTAEAYEESRLPGQPGSSNTYTRGAYCFENTLDYDANSIEGRPFTEQEETIIPRAFTTHLMMVAKFTPKYVVANQTDMKNYEAQGNTIDYTWLGKVLNSTAASEAGLILIEFPTEADARKFLTFSLEQNNVLASDPEFPTEDGRYASETFFLNSNSGNDYYSYGAMMTLMNTFNESHPASDGSYATAEDFKPFNHGWSYYYTFIAGNGPHASEAPVRFTESNVYRNHYYILRLNRISGLGTVNHPSFIRVYTMTVDGWTEGDSGRGEAS